MSTTFKQRQYDLAYDDGIDRHWWHLARNRIVLQEISKFAPISPRVLDIGCGRGIAVKYLRAAGVACVGVELAAVQPLQGLESYVRTGVNATELPLEERQGYDVITLLDVIEHVPDAGAFIASLVAAFPNLACLVITVPARQELWSNYDEYYGHYLRYDLRQLRELAESQHLTVAHSSYFFHSIYLPARALTALRAVRALRVEPPRGLGRSLHRAVAWAMALDYDILPAACVGTSAIACMHRRANVREPNSRQSD
ncbi:MAG TPA: class I SAM-dependent methyltransferase [Rudaea sp.]|nr:class I SAM-dependent methyltransferase [Rudaea sp.]